jgi:hypothetical protein
MTLEVASLTATPDVLERMRARAVGDGHLMLALLLQLARDEAKEALGRSAAAEEPTNIPASNVIRFPRKRLARRRNARALAENEAPALGQVLVFPEMRRPAGRRR